MGAYRVGKEKADELSRWIENQKANFGIDIPPGDVPLITYQLVNGVINQHEAQRILLERALQKADE